MGEVARATGLGGRSRQAGGASERARLAVIRAGGARKHDANDRIPRTSAPSDVRRVPTSLRSGQADAGLLANVFTIRLSLNYMKWPRQWNGSAVGAPLSAA